MEQNGLFLNEVSTASLAWTPSDYWETRAPQLVRASINERTSLTADKCSDVFKRDQHFGRHLAKVGRGAIVPAEANLVAALLH